MPQLDPATFTPQLIWLAIAFLLLYGLMAVVGLPRVGKAIGARRERIDGDLDKAQQMKAEAAAVIAAYERALAEARQQAQQTLKETTERLNTEAAARLRKTAELIASETAAAETRIAEAKAGALADIGAVAADVARAVAQRLTGDQLEDRVAAAVARAVVALKPTGGLLDVRRAVADVGKSAATTATTTTREPS